MAEIDDGHLDDPYSARRVKRSLAFFVVGKAASVCIGFGYLLVLVRVLDVRQYAAYVVLIALFEIVNLVSSAGVYSFAQRYITEARLPDNVGHLPRLVWTSLGYRLATLVLAGALLVVERDAIAVAVSQPVLAALLPMYALVVVFEGTSRYLDMVFDSLLEQGRGQVSAVARYGLRFLLVLANTVQGDPLGLDDVVAFEAISFGVGAAISLTAIAGSLRKVKGARGHRSGPDKFGPWRIGRFALPIYVAQVLTQVYSPDAVKLIVSRLLGAVEAAAFGFAHAISFMLQRYLPANLLIGLIRPVLVARRAGGAGDDQLVAMGNLILKVNHFLLIPVAAFFATVGTEFTTLLSGGKYPDAGLLLFLLTCLLLLQALHVVLSVIAAAIEDRKAILFATLASVHGVIVGGLFIGQFGAVAMVLGLWSSEIVWCSVTVLLLKARGFLFRVDWLAWCKLGVLAAAAAAGSTLVPWQLGGWSGLAFKGAVLMAIYLGLCAVVRPFSAKEREVINRVLPKPIFIF